MARVTIKGEVETRAERSKIKAAIGIDGLSGDGKTGLALEIAYTLANYEDEKVYVTDTENRSILLYVGSTLASGIHVGPFWHAPLSKYDGYSPFNYDYHRRRAIEKGCAVHVMDSYTHCWFRQGGVLDEVNKLAAQNSKNNKFNAWGAPDIVDAKNLLFELIRDDRIHVISTIRVKEAYAQIIDDNGKTKIQSLGEKQMQTEGLLYEFDLVLSMVSPADKHGKPARVSVTKSRYDIFEKNAEYDMTPEVIKALADYLEQGLSQEILDERIRTEMVDSLRPRIQENATLYAIFKDRFPEKKLAELSLKDLRALNAEFITITYNN